MTGVGAMPRSQSQLRPSDDPVHKLAASLVLVSAIVALAGAGQLSAGTAVAAAVAAVGGAWGLGAIGTGGVGSGVAGGSGSLTVRVLGWVIVAVPMVLVIKQAARAGGGGLLITATALTLVATALEIPTSRSLLVRSWLGTGAAVLAVSLSDHAVVKAAVVVAVAATLASLARWSRRNGAPPGEVAEVPFAPSASAPNASAPKASASNASVRWTLGPAVAVLVAAAVLAGALVTLLPESQSRPLGSGTAGSWLEGLTGATATDGDSGASGRRVRSYVAGSMDLNARGDLGDRPLFTVPAGDAGLWRSAVLDTYDGSRWRGTAGVTEAVGVGDGMSMIAEAPEDPVRGRVWQTSEVELLPGGFFPGDVPVLAPGPVTSVLLPTVRGGGGPQLRAMPGLRLTVDLLGRGSHADAYSVSWADLTTPATAALLRPQDRAVYTSLPATLPQRVRDLSGSVVRDDDDPLGAVRAVEAELRERARYNLKSPVAPAGDDAVDHFLFSAREGFCEHFAAAEVVLLRAAGIPARIATGFLVSASDLGDDGRVVVTSGQAHAWVEVWVPGHGWVSTDPTAGTRQVPNAVESVRAALEEFLGSLSWPVLVAAMVIALVLGVVVVVVVRRRRARRPAPTAGEPGVLPARLAETYRQFQVALAGCGIRPGPTEPIRSLAVTAAMAGGLPAADLEELAVALGVVERAAFGARVPAEAELSWAGERLESAIRALIAAREHAIPVGAR